MKKVQILEMLEESPCTTYDIASNLGFSISSTSAYLCMMEKRQVIRKAGLIPGSKDNRPKVIWSL